MIPLEVAAIGLGHAILVALAMSFGQLIDTALMIIEDDTNPEEEEGEAA